MWADYNSPGVFDVYEASDEGIIRNKFTKEPLNISARGYVKLAGPTPKLRRADIIIGQLFVPKPAGYVARQKAIIHADGNLQNCRADNLSWKEFEGGRAKKRRENEMFKKPKMHSYELKRAAYSLDQILKDIDAYNLEHGTKLTYGEYVSKFNIA